MNKQPNYEQDLYEGLECPNDYYIGNEDEVLHLRGQHALDLYVRNLAAYFGDDEDAVRQMVLQDDYVEVEEVA